MTAKGLNVDDRVLAQAIALRIVQTLRIRAMRGGSLDGSERRKGVCVWRVSNAKLRQIEGCGAGLGST